MAGNCRTTFFFSYAPPQELEQENFWTFHRPVAAEPNSSTNKVLDARFIQQTVCEDRDLLITTQTMDWWQLCRLDCATHALYWPLALLPIVLGPQIHHSAVARAASTLTYLCLTLVAVGIGVRLANGTAVDLSSWTTVEYNPDWTKYIAARKRHSARTHERTGTRLIYPCCAPHPKHVCRLSCCRYCRA